MGLDIEINEGEKRVYTAIPKGAIDTNTYQLLESRLKEVCTKANALIVDMSQVNYISSMGLSVIFRIKIALEERQATLALVNMQPPVKKVFETMNILSPQIFASLTEADDFLDKFLDRVQKGTIKPPE
jgi:anti-sigma B factor antagonist